MKLSETFAIRFKQTVITSACLLMTMFLMGCGSSQGVSSMDRITLDEGGFVLFGETNKIPVFLLISELPTEEVEVVNSGSLWSAMRGYNTLVLEHKDDYDSTTLSTAEFKVLNYNKAGDLTMVTVKDQPGLIKQLTAVIEKYPTATSEELATFAIQLKELVKAE